MRNDKFQRAIMETMQESPEASENPSNAVLYLLRGQRTDGLVIPNRAINPTISAHAERDQLTLIGPILMPSSISRNGHGMDPEAICSTFSH